MKVVYLDTKTAIWFQTLQNIKKNIPLCKYALVYDIITNIILQCNSIYLCGCLNYIRIRIPSKNTLWSERTI